MKTEIQAGFVPPEALEWTRANYGLSALSVHERAISMLRAQAQNPASMKLDVNGGAYSFNGMMRLFPGGQSPAFTAPTAGTRLDILYLDAATGELAIVQGTAAVAITDPLELPNAPTGAIPLVAVHLAAGQESIIESDLYDLRAFLGSYAAIASVVLTANVTSITFSNIPNSYIDLLLTGVARTDRASVIDYVDARVNGDSGTNYDRLLAHLYPTTYAYVAERSSQRFRLARIEGGDSTAGAFSGFWVHFPAYSNNFTWKPANSGVSFTRSPGTSDASLVIALCAGMWKSTAAITSLSLFPALGTNFVTGSQFYLWGLR